MKRYQPSHSYERQMEIFPTHQIEERINSKIQCEKGVRKKKAMLFPTGEVLIYFKKISENSY